MSVCRACCRAPEPLPEESRGRRAVRPWTFLLLLVCLSGCPVTQPQGTPVPQVLQTEPNTGAKYWLYVPSTYKPDRAWPLAVTLHGTHGWDGADPQIREWKRLAEDKGFLVAAPELKSVQGILPVVKGLWFKDLQDDERKVLAVIDAICDKYKVDRKTVLLTGFSAGGYPLYYIGLRNPQRFLMLIARACNSDIDLLESVKLTDETRKLPIVIYWGKDDLGPIQDQSWMAFRYLRERGFKLAEKEEFRGGHLRKPDLAYDYWAKHLPWRYRQQ